MKRLKRLMKKFPVHKVAPMFALIAMTATQMTDVTVRSWLFGIGQPTVPAHRRK